MSSPFETFSSSIDLNTFSDTLLDIIRPKNIWERLYFLFMWLVFFVGNFYKNLSIAYKFYRNRDHQIAFLNRLMPALQEHLELDWLKSHLPENVLEIQRGSLKDLSPSYKITPRSASATKLIPKMCLPLISHVLTIMCRNNNGLFTFTQKKSIFFNPLYC